jgi:hypothetical protein
MLERAIKHAKHGNVMAQSHDRGQTIKAFSQRQQFAPAGESGKPDRACFRPLTALDDVDDDALPWVEAVDAGTLQC